MTTPASSAPDSGRRTQRDRIIEVAAMAFSRQGIKSVTMDFIAHSLTMSKRTLYQIFSDKEELLLACVKAKHEENQRHANELLAKSETVLDFLLLLFAERIAELEEVRSCFFEELIKYPKVKAFFRQMQQANSEEAVKFLNRGIEQGLFRPSVNFHIVYFHLTSGIDLMRRHSSLQKFSQLELFMNTVIPYIRGCATMKGIEVIDRFIELHQEDITVGK